jgi:tetratricopeptide (TPR) repeat protein
MTVELPPPAETQSLSRYPGTHPFGDSPEDQARFFGRDEETEQLHLRVLSVPLLVQFGRSGLGKTSLLQAGLFPRLRKKPFLPAMIRLNDPNDSVSAAVTRSLREACDAEGLEFLPGDTSSLWQLLATTTIWRGDLLLTPVLVFDQFEEVFTLRDAEFRRSVAAELGAVASAKPGSVPPVKIVISLREDYLGALEEFSAAIPGLFHERLRLEAMSEEAARAAITGPAGLEPGPNEPPYASPRFELDREALEAMVDYLQGSSGVIEPFQLQLLCGHAEGIAMRKVGQPVTMTLDDFRGSHAFASVLHNFYRGTLDKLSPPSQRKRAAALCEEGLLDAAGHRLMLHEGQIVADYHVKPLTLAALCQTRLIRSERRMESTFYEISHDRLAESIVAARQGRLPKKVRRLLWTAGVAAVVVVALLLAWNQSVERQRQAAQNARDSAEGLLTFLLGEQFLGEIRDTGRSSMMEAVRRKVEESGTAGRTPLNRALALRHQGDMKRIGNDLPHSLESQRQSLAIFERLGDEREIARAHDRLARVLEEQKQVADSSSHFERSIQSWDRVTAASGAGADDCVEMATALLGAYRMNGSAGRAGRAGEQLDRAVRIASDVLFGGKGPCAAKWESIAPFPHAGAVAVLSEVAFMRAEPGNAAGTAAMADQARKLKPQSVKARRRALLMLRERGSSNGQPAGALQDMKDALAGFDELGRWDPRNAGWTHDRALAQLTLARAIAGCHLAGNNACSPLPPLENAQAMTLEALTTLGTLAAADRTNQSLQANVGYALETYVTVMMTAGGRTDLAEALARLQESERFWSARRRDPADTLGILEFGQILQLQAFMLFSLERPAEAMQTLQRAIAIYEPLERRQPDNIEYIDSLASARGFEKMLRGMLGDAAGAAAAGKEMQRLDEARQKANRPALEKEVSVRADQFDLINKIGDLMYGRKYAEALPVLMVMEELSRREIVLSPANFASYSGIGQYYMNIAEAQKALGNSAAELGNLAAAMNAAQVAAWLAPEQQREPRNLTLLDARNDVATALFARKRSAEALQIVRENIALAEEMAERRECIDCRWHLGVAKCLFATGQRDFSADWLRSGIIHIESASKESRNAGIFSDLGHWRLMLAGELEKSGSKPAADEQRRLALAAYRQVPGDAATKAAITAIEKMIGPG